MYDERPTVGSLFSGIGGLDLGLERAGFRVRWQCESDEYARRVLAQHWPGVACYPDVRTLGCDVPRVDLLCGGFPCQPVSVAGKRRAQDDPRWLWPAFRDAIRLLRPTVVLLENVPGLRSAGLRDVLADLAALGLDAEWTLARACDFGAPHIRARLFVVASDPHRLSLRLESGWISRAYREAQTQLGCHGAAGDVADADGLREPQPQGQQSDQWRRLGDGGWWRVEPAVGRVADGVPARLDRLRTLGNAVVPQVAEWIGRQILTHCFGVRVTRALEGLGE